MQSLQRIFFIKQINPLKTIACGLHTSRTCLKTEGRKEMLASMPVQDEGTEGEKTISMDSLISKKKEDVFPDENTPTTIFYGIPFKDIPIVNIKVSPNNTIMNLTDVAGFPMILRSCGIEGFKNTRKGTNVAAQATAISLSTRILERGIRTVRVCVAGLGPGRMSAVKGLQMGGLNIVSITDTTPVDWHPNRPRKARRL